MGFLERAIRRGISDGIGKAVGNAISQAVQPKATEMANKAATYIDNASSSATNASINTAGFEGALSNLERAAQEFATQQAKNIKMCPSCNSPATAEHKFCPSCGASLPEETVAQASVCSGCGKQNSIGTKFCVDCGTKLPSAIMEEEMNRKKNEEFMAMWDEKLFSFPKWSFGGESLCIDEYDGYYAFNADFKGNSSAARNALEQYRILLQQNGFRPAGQYPSDGHLYKMINGICYHADLEHCFEGGSDCVSLAFLTGEPSGGFNYVKPEPKKPASLKDLFNF